jgi:hypothetical protein
MSPIKPKFNININELKRSSKIPNIQIKNAKIYNIAKAIPDPNMKNVKSRFLQETATYSNRLQKSKEQIERNHENRQPKNFVVGRVKESLFADYELNINNNDDFDVLLKPNYQIIPKINPVKPAQNISLSKKESKIYPKYIFKNDKSKKSKRGVSESKK